MEGSKQITSLPKFYFGFALGLPGVFFMTQDESWLAIVISVFGGGLKDYLYLQILVEFFPLIMFVVGVALMLKAREKRKYGETS